ncbi:lamin tail domain-containing protein [Nocardiopsis ansamitocini]|uniref:LTD domain-containing protein n=1 Tax=Nocardiopsis ansamitocini TaxID=1670832 RepID=A0A9W6P5I8_9ACTN|nr:lamin tail domain-containing protein [Nocardiopsis ansamitocini]GLU47458.1 hypothetical protein Nans01_18090 [Nocardiopsis ansamitocini]
MRTRSLIASLLMALTASLLMATPAEAAPALQFTFVAYDSPGTDNRSNSSLNAEYVVIKNTTKKAVNLKGYVLHDAPSTANKSKGRKWNYAYTFGSFSLAAGKSVTVRTGSGGNTATTRYWNFRQYVWNNDRDTATLLNAKGAKVDTCSWTTTKPGSTKC